MKDNVYIGARYVVSPEGEYDPLKEYESLSMVSYENSGVYVSRQPVPVNTPPTKGGSDSYWALMFPVDPQIKDFEKQLQDMAAQLNNAIADMREEIANNNQNVLDQIAAKFAQQDAAITKATTDVANFIDTGNQTITEYTNKVDGFIAEYDPPAEAYGLLPQLVITANPSATVTAVQGSTVRSGTVPASGVLYLNLNAYGAWRVTASFQAQETSQTVTVDDVKQYTLNLTQAERNYKITITNNSDLPIVGESLYQVTGPNGFSQSHNMAVTSAWECDVPVAGIYTIEAKIANLLPSKNRTSEAVEYVPTSISGSIIYTTVATTTATVTNEQETATASLSIPKLTVTLANVSGYQEIQIQPPVVTEKSTSIYHNSDFAFIPWARGNWFMRNSTADFEYTESIPNLNGYNGTVELAPLPIELPEWVPSFTQSYSTNELSVKKWTNQQVSNALAEYYNSVYADLLVPIAVDISTGKTVGKLEYTNGWNIEGGKPITSKHVICTYIPKFQLTKQSTYKYVVAPASNDTDTLAAFKHGGKTYSGIAVGFHTVGKTGAPRGGLDLSPVNMQNVPSTALIPNYTNAEYLNVDHLFVIWSIFLDCLFNSYVGNNSRHCITDFTTPSSTDLWYAQSQRSGTPTFVCPLYKEIITIPSNESQFVTETNNYDVLFYNTNGAPYTSFSDINANLKEFLTGKMVTPYHRASGAPYNPTWGRVLATGTSAPLNAHLFYTVNVGENAEVHPSLLLGYEKSTQYKEVYPVFYIE